MNDQIKKLMAQATYDVLGVKQVDQQLFAELIVRECSTLCSNLKVTYAGECDLTPNEIAKETAEDLANIIKLHFGVEE